MSARLVAALAVAVAAVLAGPVAHAQPTRPPNPDPAAPSPAAPNPVPNPSAVPQPQRTSATYGDWELRCDRTGAVPACEAAQTITNPQGQTIAQIAVGRAMAAEPMRVALVVPASANLLLAPRLLPAARDATPDPAPILTLVWRRCLPEACVADAVIGQDTLALLRTATEPLRLVLQDGLGRERAIPLSPRGFAQTLDAMPKPTR